MAIRQPIVSVLGHVDHGKTTLLDHIRGSTVVKKEAGRITQHIGATEVPLETIEGICSDVMGNQSFKIPGLLFIDTPGHHSFTTLRSRGGSLADLAVLIIDVREGFMPQTLESLNILKRFRTPFVIAANKVDRINGWKTFENQCFLNSWSAQDTQVQQVLDDAIYKMIGVMDDEGFKCDRYDRVKDFTDTAAIVPISAISGEGVADLLMIMVGLAQKFLEEQLESEEGPGLASVLEVKEVRGLGTTLDTIVYDGTLSSGDTIVVGTTNEPVVTKVKALLKPKPLEEIRVAKGEQFDTVASVSAAAGIKISAPNLEDALAGAPVRVANDDVDRVVSEVAAETNICIDCQEEGVSIRADALGSLEALSYELTNREIPIKSVGIGDISKRDIIEASATTEPLKRVLLAFNVNVLPDAQEALAEADLKLLQHDIIYKLIEDYEDWFEKATAQSDADLREVVVHPGKYLFLENCSFRINHPAVFGIRVLAGRVRVGSRILRPDGRTIGKIQSIQKDKNPVKEAKQGDEVAISVPGMTIGRQCRETDVLYVDIPEGDARRLRDVKLNTDEREILEEVIRIKRKEKVGWGM